MRTEMPKLDVSWLNASSVWSPNGPPLSEAQTPPPARPVPHPTEGTRAPASGPKTSILSRQTVAQTANSNMIQIQHPCRGCKGGTGPDNVCFQHRNQRWNGLFGADCHVNFELCRTQQPKRYQNRLVAALQRAIPELKATGASTLYKIRCSNASRCSNQDHSKRAWGNCGRTQQGLRRSWKWW